MPDAAQRRKNIAPWWGFLFAVAAVGCNAAFFLRPPLQGALPWLSLLFAILALTFLVTGLRRAFGVITEEGASIAVFTPGHNAHSPKTIAARYYEKATYDTTFPLSPA